MSAHCNKPATRTQHFLIPCGFSGKQSIWGMQVACCTSCMGDDPLPYLHGQWKGFAMTANFTCTVNFQLPCFEDVCTDLFVELLCCLFIFHLNSAFCRDGWTHLKPSTSRLEMSLQTAQHGDRGGFGQCGRCRCRNALPAYLGCEDGKLWYKDAVLFSVLSRPLRKSVAVAQIHIKTSTFLDYTDFPEAGSCFEHGLCSIFINSSLCIMGGDN